MDITSRIGGPGNGLFPSDQDVRVIAREALTAGDLCQFDFNNESADVTSTVPGNNASGFASVVNPVTGFLTGAVFGVALEDIAADASGYVRIRGIVNANVDGSTVAGSLLVPAVDGQLDLAGTTGFKVVGIALAADASSFANILFDGISGFGQAPES